MPRTRHPDPDALWALLQLEGKPITEQIIMVKEALARTPEIMNSRGMGRWVAIHKDEIRRIVP